MIRISPFVICYMCHFSSKSRNCNRNLFSKTRFFCYFHFYLLISSSILSFFRFLIVFLIISFHLNLTFLPLPLLLLSLLLQSSTLYVLMPRQLNNWTASLCIIYRAYDLNYLCLVYECLIKIFIHFVLYFPNVSILTPRYIFLNRIPNEKPLVLIL